MDMILNLPVRVISGRAGRQHESVRRFGLSPRQHEILALLCQGMTNKLIARRLGISPGTVKVHTGRLYRNLGVDNRLQAVAKALRP